jgi:glutaredoxin 3
VAEATSQHSEVRLYSTQFCPFCVRAKRLLTEKGVRFIDIPVDGEPGKRQEMIQASGRHTVPQIWIGNLHVGGFDDLWSLEQQGRLQPLLYPTTTI